MITLLTGAPGSGKTAALVDLLRQVGKDRPLYVYGLNGYKPAHIPLEDPTKWMETVPDGAAVVIDEVQQIWRPRGPGVKVPDHVAALETHRHRGLDFFLTTQGPNLLDANVRALVGRHIHLRELGVLGRMWYEWPETADNCRTGFRGAPIKKRYRLPKHVFEDYKSASMHIKPIRSFPMALVVAIVAIAIAAYMAFGFYQKLQSNIAGGKKPASQELHAFRGDPAQQRIPAPSAAEALREKMGLPPAPTTPSTPVSDALGGNTGTGKPAPVFAGCAVARARCVCFDTAGNITDSPEGACERVGGLLDAPLTLADPEPAPRPSNDPEADYAMIRATTKRQPLPLVY